MRSKICLIKDKATRKIILNRTLKDGLYHLDNISVKGVAEVGYGNITKLQHLHKNEDNSNLVLIGGINLVNINVAVSKVIWHNLKFF